MSKLEFINGGRGRRFDRRTIMEYFRRIRCPECGRYALHAETCSKYTKSEPHIVRSPGTEE